MTSRAGEPVPIALVEDHEATRAEVVAGLLDFSDRVRLVGAFPDAESLLRGAALSDVSVVLVDLGLPGMSGVELIGRLAKTSPQIRAIALTAFEDETNVFDALSQGAHGYLIKHEGLGRVVSAVEEAAAGEYPISSRVVGFLISRARKAPPPVALTGREEELALALSEGLAYAECAERMQIALGTVQHHVKRLYRKLDVNSRKEVSAWLKRHPPVR